MLSENVGCLVIAESVRQFPENTRELLIISDFTEFAQSWLNLIPTKHGVFRRPIDPCYVTLIRLNIGLNLILVEETLALVLCDVYSSILKNTHKTQEMTTSDRSKVVPLSSHLFYVCLTCICNELMHNWRHGYVCMCMSVLCLRGGCMFFAMFPAWAFSYPFTHQIIHK